PIFVDRLTQDGLWCAIARVHMGDHGGNVSDEEGISREEQAEWAYRSHPRALAAIDDGRMAEEIAPVNVMQKEQVVTIETDEGPRRDTSLEALAKLKPAFPPHGTEPEDKHPGV